MAFAATPRASGLKQTTRLACLDARMHIEQRRRGTEKGLDRLLLDVDAA